MRLNENGISVREEWFRSTEMRREIQLYADEFVVMPNHVHGVVWIVGVGRCCRGDASVAPTAPTPTYAYPPGRYRQPISSMVGSFKSAVTKRIKGSGHAGCPRVATQLLRTHHPQRRLPAPHSRIHRDQPFALAPGPRKHLRHRHRPIGCRMVWTRRRSACWA